MASTRLVNFFLVFSCMILVASCMRFRLTLTDGATLEGDIDQLDEVHVGDVSKKFATPKIRYWAIEHIREILPLEPQLREIKLSKILSTTESLDYLEDLIQENDPVVQAFVIELFYQAGMRLELIPCQ